MARRIPGKEEFDETLRYYRRQLELTGVDVRLGQRASTEDLSSGFDLVVLATGVQPRQVSIPGSDHPKVLSYVDVLLHGAEVGDRVAIVGSGGIGFDVAEFLTHEQDDQSPIDSYLDEWGVDRRMSQRGGLKEASHPPSKRQVTLCQRSSGKLGGRLGKTTGWIHRTSLKNRQVTMLANCSYERIDDSGFHVVVDGTPQLLEVDTVVICAGQVPERELVEPLQAAGVRVELIGGADKAAELDARRAIDQGTRLAASL